MQVYQKDHNGIFAGSTTADPNPLEPGEFIIPGGCVTVAPPTIPSGMRARWSGSAWIIEPAAIDPGVSAPELSLTQRRLIAVAEVNRLAGDARLPYITDVPGQEMIYPAKEAEAKAFLAAQNPNLSDYPFLAAETGITAGDPITLANLWLAMGQQWRQIAAQIEGARIGAIRAISQAQTTTEIETALADCWQALNG